MRSQMRGALDTLDRARSISDLNVAGPIVSASSFDSSLAKWLRVRYPEVVALADELAAYIQNNTKTEAQSFAEQCRAHGARLAWFHKWKVVFPCPLTADVRRNRNSSVPRRHNLYFQLTAMLALLAVPIAAFSQDNGFGRRQVKQLLADRPDMKDVIGRDHPVYRWVVDGFQGKYLGQRVYWNANSPRAGRAAEHAVPYGTYPPYISISGGTETTPVDKWGAVVFELCNLQNHEAFARLATDASAGKLTADEYAKQCVMLEYDAQLRTHRLFAANPLPDSHHGRDRWYNTWVKSELPTAEKFKATHAVPGSTRTNYDYFKKAYTTQIAPYIRPSKDDEPSDEPKSR